MLSPARGKIPISPGTARRSWPLSSTTSLTPVWATLLVLCFFFSPTARAEQERGQTPDITIVPKPMNDTLDAVQIRDVNKNVPPDQKAAEIQDSCLLPPLSLVRSPIVSATALAVPSKARKEYQAAAELSSTRKTNLRRNICARLSRSIPNTPLHG